MKPKLFALLVEKIEEFIESKERCDDVSFYIGEETAVIFARAVEAVYDGMTNAVELEEENK